MSLVIHAPNVHQGGGRTLLLALLQAAGPGTRAILDERLELPNSVTQSLAITRVAPTLLARFKSEWQLGAMLGAADTVLSFGNLPPLFSTRARVVLFLQNRHLVSATDTAGFPLHVRLRIVMERVWLRWRLSAISLLVVQTPSMQREVEQILGMKAQVMPFVASSRGYTRRPSANIDAPAHYDFIYVASSDPHKNHLNLLDAWILLAQENIYPSLCLTLATGEGSDLKRRIAAAMELHSVRIQCRGDLRYEDMQTLYRQSRALIYPSMVESFGLPLIEARCAGLAILAAERDYVRDVVDPEETFDPESPVSIARAVKRFLGLPEAPLSLTGAAEFLRALDA